MIAQVAVAGSLVVDSLPYSAGGSSASATNLKSAGVDCLVGYLGSITSARVGYLLDVGIAFMPVTFGTAPDHYNGAASVTQCQALGIPSGVSVWLDLEGMPAFRTDPATLIDEANAWAAAVSEAGYMPCLYVGVPQPLTSSELYGLRHERYWHGQGEVRDRHNAFANPACGWCMKQQWPSKTRGGVLVDDNTLEPDVLGRLPVWCTGE